ncbi:ABC transporter ATP-binding protein [Paenibacillus sp. GCM10027627]|uniref:ABC transporter ATP-binding protein n=1 Tax=unclassified Paenibacillus TaxID=185978 RepID=UPI00362EE04F
MNETVLNVSDLSKSIRGKMIVENINFRIQEGEIVGFLGPNGAGKTTTIRMLVDLIKPSSGEVNICGYSVAKRPEQALRHVGCIVENPEMYSYMTGWQNLEHFARMLDGIGHNRLKEVASIVQLDDRIHDKVKTYSLGMRQRLGIAQALLGRPKLLILDEPTNGLDPKGIKELRAFVRKLADDGLSLLVSSHLLSEIQWLCDRVVIIDGGKIVAEGHVEQLIHHARSYVHWRLAPLEAGRDMLRSDPMIRVEEQVPGNGALEGIIAAVMADEHIPNVVERLVRGGIQVLSVCRSEPTLEDLFLALTEGESTWAN